MENLRFSYKCQSIAL